MHSELGSQIALDYENALRLVSEVLFTRSSGFILEFVQNAEDAGIGLESAGALAISLNRERIRIVHNGRPFSQEDVEAICGIRSSKKPEKGTLGYLGIGFKSVFKVTNCPQIHSGGFQFKFDKTHWPARTALWRVLPVWVDRAPEPVDPGMTTFIVPLRDPSYYDMLRRELQNLGTQLYLFLRWLKSISIYDEVGNVDSKLLNLGVEDGITTLRRDGSTERFKFFRKVVRVPEDVQRDELTQEYRANVTEREIAVAFALDRDGNLEPTAAGAMFGGVYSFVPLGEAGSGAKFPIQGDFLVQPGRDALNCEARWNEWLVEEVAELCEEAVAHFSKHPVWMYQFLPVFAAKATDGESAQRLFGPKLLEPLASFLRSERTIPTASGGWARPRELIRLDETQQAIDRLRSLGVLNDDELPGAFGGEPGLQLVHPVVRDGGDDGINIRRASRTDLLRNEEFLSGKAQAPNAAEWFRALYLWLHENPVFSEYRVRRAPVKRPQGYHDYAIVLTADCTLLPGGQVHLLDVEASEPTISQLAAQMVSARHILHPDILGRATSDIERQALRGFVTGLMGVQLLDAAKVCQEALLPRINITATEPAPEDVVSWTRTCARLLGSNVPDSTEIWALTKEGDVRPARECLLGTEYKPEENWEANRQYVPGIRFVSSSYLDSGDSDECILWRWFFRKCGVREAPANGVEEFAVRFAEEKLRRSFADVTRVEKFNLGYDLSACASDGTEFQVEVKGITEEKDVELTANETAAADEHKASYLLCVVAGIPENPVIYKVTDPARKGKKDKVTIAPSVWKAFRWD